MRKTWVNSFLLGLASFLLFAFQSNAQNNNLAAGDIAYVSYHTDAAGSNNDLFSIVVLRVGGIPGGTVIYFTDNGWSNISSDWLASSEGYLQWTAPAAGVSQGVEIYFSSDATDNWSVTSGTLALASGADLFTLGNGGDQILAYQTGPTGGPAGAYLNTTRRFIAGIHCNIVTDETTQAGWDVGAPGGSGANRSELPPGLTCGAASGNTAFIMTKTALPFAGTVTATEEPDNGKYDCAGASGSDPSTLRDAVYLIGASANWTLSDVAFTTGQFSNRCNYFGLASLSTQPLASSACYGVNTSFTVSATGTGLSYQWQESTDIGFTSPTNLANTGVYSNVATATLNISDNSALNGKYYRVAITNTNGTVNSNGVLLTVTGPTLPSSNTLAVHVVNTQNNYWYGASCALVGRVIPSGGVPISGNTAFEVWREASVLTYGGQPYVQRHYQVTPTAGSTGTVTFYYTQTEFDNFNAHPGSVLNLPTGPGDAAGIANMRYSKYNGSTNNGTGLPGSYTGGGQVLNPVDANVVYDVTFSRWEVTMDVSGFSGFFLQTYFYLLPVNLISFSAQKANNDIRVKWQTADETSNDHFELERSLNGRTFTGIGQRTGNNGTGIKNYDWLDAGAVSLTTSKIFYRLKIVSLAGKVEYSNTIVVYPDKQAVMITGVNPNPFIDKLNVNFNMPKTGQVIIKFTDMTGRVLRKEYTKVLEGFSTYTMTGIEKVAAGIYFLSINFEGEVSTFKVVK